MRLLHFLIVGALYSIGIDASLKRKANAMEPDVFIKKEATFLIVSAEEDFRKETTNELIFHCDRAKVTLQLTAEKDIRIISEAKKGDFSEDEGFEQEAKVYALYCNVQTMNCKNAIRTLCTLQPGNFILLFNRKPSPSSLNSFVHGIQIGALNTKNIQAALKSLFCCTNPQVIFIEDFPPPSELNAPEVSLEEYVLMKKSSVWSYWPLRLYDEDEQRMFTVSAFEKVNDKDVYLVKENGPKLAIISQTYPQLNRFTQICTELSVTNPWTLYTALSSGSFIPHLEGKKENMCVALFLIEKDPENIKVLVDDFEIIQKVAYDRKKEEETTEAMTKLCLFTLSMFGIKPAALTTVIKKYSGGSIFENMLEDPDIFLQYVDTFDYLELCNTDLAFILSLIRHFLTCKPPSDVYLRTLLWLYRIESKLVNIENVDMIRADIEDAVSLKAWDFANMHCTRQTKLRFSHKKRVPIPFKNK